MDDDFVAVELAGECGRPDEVLAVGRGEHAHVDRGAPQGLAAGNAEQLFPGRVDLYILPIAAARQPHGEGHELEDAGEALFRLAQAQARASGFVNVLRHAPQPDDLAMLQHRLAAGPDPEPAAIGAQDFQVHASLLPVVDAVAECLAQLGLVFGGHVLRDVVFWQWGFRGQTVDLEAHV